MSLLPKRKNDWTASFPVLGLRDEMNKLFDDFFRGDRTGVPAVGQWAPALDVSETDTQVIVKAEVPGMEAKDIEVSITGDMLIIKGEKKEETERKEQDYHLMERRYGSFQRAVSLPSSVDSSKVKAGYSKGVLTITIEKKERSKPRNIEIKPE